MSLRIPKLVFASLLLAAGIGCQEQGPRTGDGRLDLMVRPSFAAASSGAMPGSFLLTGLDRAGSRRVAIERAGETTSVQLPPGIYAAEWQPAVSLESGEVAPTAMGSRKAPTLVVFAGQVTTLALNFRQGVAPKAELASAARDSSVDLRVANR